MLQPIQHFAFALLFMLNAYSGAAQPRNATPEADFALQFASSITVESGSELSQVIEVSQDEILVIFRKGKDEYTGYNLSHETMELTKIGTLLIEDSKDEHTFTMVGDRLMWAFFRSSDKEKLNCLYLQELDRETMQMVGDEMQVDCLQGDEYYKDFKNSFAATKVSPDRSKLLVYYKLPEPPEGGKLFRFAAFDDGLNKLWTQDVPTKLEEDRILKIGNAEWFMVDKHYGVAVVSGQGGNHSSIAIDNKANVFFWSRVDFGRELKKFERFKTYWSKVNALGVMHKLMERSAGTQRTGGADPFMHLSNSKATLIEFYSDEGRGGYAFMTASDDDGVDGFHYAQWSEQYEPNRFYNHEFTRDEIMVPATMKQYSKIRGAEKNDKSIMMDANGLNMLHLPGTDEVFFNIFQNVHAKYSNVNPISGLLTYHLNSNEDLSYLGGFAYHQGEHLDNYRFLGVVSVPHETGVYHFFNDNRKNLKGSYNVREDTYPFFTASNPIALVPSLLQTDDVRSGKRQQLTTSASLGGEPLNIDRSFRTEQGTFISAYQDELKYTFFKVHPRL